MSAGLPSLRNTVVIPAAASVAEFIEAPLPESVWIALEMLYSSAFASRSALQAVSVAACAWTERTQGSISAVLLFHRTGPVVQVLNEVVHLNAGQIQRFAQAVFRRYPEAHFVQLHAIDLDADCAERADSVSVPMMCSVFSEDYVLDLPPDYEHWLAGLSRQTREKIRYHLRRSFRREPGLTFSITYAAAISESDVRAVLQLNRERMQHKRKAYGMTAADEAQLCGQMAAAGMLCVLRLDGRICAGLLCSVVGSDITMHVIAHDPRYDDLRLGLLCCCLTIQQAIGQRLARFHFLWGHYDYKRKLGGQPRPLSRVLMLRSAWQGVRHPLRLGRWLAVSVTDALRRWRRERNPRDEQHQRTRIKTPAEGQAC